MVTEPQGLDLNKMLAGFETAAKDLQLLDGTLLQPLEKALADDPSLFKPAFVESFPATCSELRAWLASGETAIPVLV